MYKVLIIEDEVKIALMLAKSLEKEGFFVDMANDGYKGKKMALGEKYDTIILDINLPMINGYQICREVRKNNIETPVIMLTSAGSIDDKLAGFDFGADDYMVKPFEFRELLARINVFLRRSEATNESNVILRFADIEMNITTNTVRRSNQFIPLTVKEFALLEVLIRNKGRIVSKVELAEKVWQISFQTGTNIIEVCINYLRKKIDRDFPVKLIHTMIGMGYVLKEDVISIK